MKMEDIAKLAGVSKGAVSLAINGKPGISAETRERILQIAKEHQYFPKAKNPAAEASTKSLTFLVCANSGLVMEQYYQQPFFRELIHYIEERCRYKGYSLLFSTINMDTFEQDIHTIAKEKQSKGVILLGTNLTPHQIEEIARLIPALVVLDNGFDELPVHFVQINNFMGAYQAGTHLYDIGHRTIGYIASNERINNFEERKRGFAAALEERGLTMEEDHIFSIAPTILSSQESLTHQLKQYLQQGRPLPTAFFCECDYIAISAMRTLHELGYRIPEDVSVIGFDNISEAVIVTPELTTIHVEKERMAHLAVDLLIESFSLEHHVKTKIKVDTRFVERNSCSVPAKTQE